MNFTNLLHFEWKLQFFRLPALLLLTLFVLVVGYGAISGLTERDERLAAIDAHHADIGSAMQDWLSNLEQLETLGNAADVPPWAGSAMDVVFASSLPQSPISDFAVGQSDLLPYLGAVSLWDPDIRLFSKYEFADPVSLALGNFDISKAIVLFLPLVILVFCFDVIAADRDAKRLSLTMLQVASIKRLFWQRLLLRAGIVIALTLCVACFALLLGSTQFSLGERLPGFLIWSLCTVFYGLFWALIVGLIASFNRSGEFNVLVLLGVWATLTLVIPAAGSAVSEVFYPTPSRLAYLAEAREIENETRQAESDVANEFMLDHPELLVDQTSEIPGYVLSSFLVTTTVDEATRPIVDSYELAISNREGVLGLFRYLSPAIAAHGLFNELAGTSGDRHQRYLQQARQFKAEYAALVGPNVVAKRPISSDYFRTLSGFAFEDESLAQRLGRELLPFLFFLLVAIAMTLVINRQLDKTSPIDS